VLSTELTLAVPACCSSFASASVGAFAAMASAIGRLSRIAGASSPGTICTNGPSGSLGPVEVGVVWVVGGGAGCWL
jgi:hypothetical protein